MVSFSFEEEPELPEQGRERSYSERSVDEAVERSSGTLSPTSPTVGLEGLCPEDVDFCNAR